MSIFGFIELAIALGIGMFFVQWTLCDRSRKPLLKLAPSAVTLLITLSCWFRCWQLNWTDRELEYVIYFLTGSAFATMFLGVVAAWLAWGIRKLVRKKWNVIT